MKTFWLPIRVDVADLRIYQKAKRSITHLLLLKSRQDTFQLSLRPKKFTRTLGQEKGR
jgi:hypothetical protein